MKVQAIHESPFPSHGMLIAAPHTHTHTHKHDQAQLFKALVSLDPYTDLFWQSFESISPPQLETFHQEQVPSVNALKQLLQQN